MPRFKSLPIVADRPRRPEWMMVRGPSAGLRYFEVKKLVEGASLHTICEEARCPNIAECWGRGCGVMLKRLGRGSLRLFA